MKELEFLTLILSLKAYFQNRKIIHSHYFQCNCKTHLTIFEHKKEKMCKHTGNIFLASNLPIIKYLMRFLKFSEPF